MDRAQIRYGGLLLGAGTPYRWLELDGWDDLPGMDDGDEPRPDRHGEWASTTYAQARYVTLSGRIQTQPGGSGELVRRLRSATAPAPDGALSDLVVRTGDGEQLTARARVALRTISHRRGYRVGWVALTVQWVCPDPRRYAPTTTEVVVPAGQSRPAPHMGDVATHPRVRIHGPCTDPVVRVHTAGSQAPRALGWALTLDVGEWLDIDTDAGVTLDQDGESRAGAAASGSVPAEYWTLPPGEHAITLDAADTGPATRAVLTYRHAYL